MRGHRGAPEPRNPKPETRTPNPDPRHTDPPKVVQKSPPPRCPIDPSGSIGPLLLHWAKPQRSKKSVSGIKCLKKRFVDNK